MLFVPFKLVLFIHSLSWPARELGWVKYEGSGVLFCLCCIVCIAFFHSVIVTNLFCLLQVPFFFTGLWSRTLLTCRIDQLSILCLHHFICSIEPLSLNLPFFVAFSFYLHRSPELATAHHALQPSPLWKEANFPSELT